MPKNYNFELLTRYCIFTENELIKDHYTSRVQYNLRTCIFTVEICSLTSVVLGRSHGKQRPLLDSKLYLQVMSSQWSWRIL